MATSTGQLNIPLPSVSSSSLSTPSGSLLAATSVGVGSKLTAGATTTGTERLSLSTSTAGGLLSAPTNSTTAPQISTSSVGLGGAGPQASAKSKVVSTSEQVVPDALAQLVEGFSQFMSKQQQLSDEISTYSDKCFRAVERDITTHSKNAHVLSMEVHHHEQSLTLLKHETSQELKAIEVAQRTKELPASLQHENVAPEEYFSRVVVNIQQKMQVFWAQLEELDAHIKAFLAISPASPNIVTALHSQHQPFLLVAAQLQVAHEQVQRLKEQYLSLRRVVLHDGTDVFADQQLQPKRTTLSGSAKMQTGPSPFAASVAQATAALAAMATAGNIPQPAQTVAPAMSLALPVGLASSGTGASISAGSGPLSGPLAAGTGLTNAGSNKPFQLQKPPLGKKKQLS